MNLTVMHDLVNEKSYYTANAFDALIWSAINEAGRRIHQWVKKEMKGFWIKWDTGSMTIIPGQDEYSLPADLDQIVRLSEKLAAETAYRQMIPIDVRTELFAERQFDALIQAVDTYKSDFVFYGPYLPELTAIADNTGNMPTPMPYNVRLAPRPQDTRQTEIIYTSKFIEIVNSQSFNPIPPEGHGVQLDFAIAELVRDNNDSLASEREQSAMRKLTEFLTWVRSRQIYAVESQEPYLEDLD